MPYMSLCVVMIDLGNLRDQIFPRTGFAPSASSAFFGLLRALHATTLHHTAKRRLDHMQQPADWHREALQRGPRPIGAAARPPSNTERASS